MNKTMLSMLTAFFVAAPAFSADQTMIWGEANKTLPQLKNLNPSGVSGIQAMLPSAHNSAYSLKRDTSASSKNNPARYQLMYHNIPVWGHQVILHNKANGQQMITGTNVSNIEQDILSLTPKMSPGQVEQTILSEIKTPIKFKTNTLIIYIDNQQKATLAYHLKFYTNSHKKPLSAPNYIVDASDGKILKEWDNARKKAIGQGLGGNSIQLPYRSGIFQHGDALPGLPSLGKFKVTERDGHCHVETPNIRVMNLENEALGYGAFPITIFDEVSKELKAFSYPCSPTSLYLNYSDNHSGPINYSFSPVNDTMYFADQTIQMYQQVYQVKKPLGDDLPLRAYTHLGNMDNAFAIPSIRVDGMLVANQQIVIGNGDYFLTAPAQAVIAHELSHNFTEINSGLIYEGQSGGINESFSDMAAIALQDYLRRDYPWYWNGEDWSIGREAVIGGEPLRYMDEPTKDGRSIDHAEHYSEGMNVHFTSGVFNKAFYLLATKPDWSIEKAFQVMVDANQRYWSPIAYYDFAACGVIQATIDRKWDKTPVVEAFDAVGVHCPMHKNIV